MDHWKCSRAQNCRVTQGLFKQNTNLGMVMERTSDFYWVTVVLHFQPSLGSKLLPLMNEQDYKTTNIIILLPIVDFLPFLSDLTTKHRINIEDIKCSSTEILINQSQYESECGKPECSKPGRNFKGITEFIRGYLYM